MEDIKKASEDSKIIQKRQRLLTEPVPGLVCRMAVPTIISMLVTSFYNLVDTFFVGLLNSNSATSAVGLVFPLMAIIQAFGFFFGHGSGNFMSRAIGEGDYRSASKMAATGFVSALSVGTVLMILGLCLRTPLTHLLGATGSLFEDTNAYLLYILIGSPWMMASLVLNNQLRLQGNSLFSMIGLVSGGVLNIGLDPLFIFVFDMGVSGAALATIISQLISCIILFIGCQKAGGVTIKLKDFSTERKYYAEMFGGGIPSLGRQGLASISGILLNNFAAGYGDAVVAGFTIVSRITMITVGVILGFGQGFQPVCGFNYGAKKYRRVYDAVWFSVKMSTAFLIVSAAVIYFIAPQLIWIFRKDPTVIAIGASVLRAQCCSMPLLGFIIMMNMLLQNIQKVFPATVLAVARQGVVFIPVLIVMKLTLGLSGIIWTQAVVDLLSFAIAIPFSLPTLRELKASTNGEAVAADE